MLLKLPSSFFPNYRIIFNVQVINNHKKNKEDTTSEYKCCKFCDSLYYYEEGKEKFSDSDRETSFLSSSISNSPPLPDYNYDDFAIKPSSTPISLSNKYQLRRNSPLVPEINDMLQILKRRYAVINSFSFFSEPSGRYSFDSLEKSEIL